MLVIESAQFMAAKRCDCILVLNEEDRLTGIFTSKDIAYRLVADGLDARTTTVSQIMTKDPLCVTSDTSATEALNLMVSRGFRHLPVTNEIGDIFGLLDITKCLYQALERMERAFGLSQKLYDALEGVERHWAKESTEVTDYLENMRKSMSCPTLESVLDEIPPAEVKHRTNVKEIAVMMRKVHTTAVLVTRSHTLQGIFTSKDIVLRVIAAGLNPENCTVARVMTPKPDIATPETTVLDALKLMNKGHYLNLPIVGNGIIVGMVDVLKLTYVILEQMSIMQGTNGESDPAISFWDSFGAAVDPMDSTDPTEDKPHISENFHQRLSPPSFLSPQPSTSTTSYSDIYPSESASMTQVNEASSALTAASPAAEDKFTFKFTFYGTTHRVVSKPSYHDLIKAICLKLPAGESEGGWLSLSYVDDEEDQVLMTCDSDVKDAVDTAVKTGYNKVKLLVQDKRMNGTKTSSVVSEDADETKLWPIVDNSKERKQLESNSSRLLLPNILGTLGITIFGAYLYLKIKAKPS
ncbi:hypothetical protein G6F32_006203 [Rhizopus arrhizus]|nr:hypothetical protein G6F32_006203 [Rhizopus arrhizus]